MSLLSLFWRRVPHGLNRCQRKQNIYTHMWTFRESKQQKPAAAPWRWKLMVHTWKLENMAAFCVSRLGKINTTHARTCTEQRVEVWSVMEKKRSAHKGWRYLGDVRACVRHKTPLRGKSLLSYAYRRCAPEIWKIFYIRWPAPALSYPAARHKWISTSHMCGMRNDSSGNGNIDGTYIDRLSHPERALI